MRSTAAICSAGELANSYGQRLLCVQVVTVNDYLARRDSEWVGQVPRFLGLKVRFTL